MPNATWDTIIIGAGSAGCAVAGGLAIEPKRRILLLEAGPHDYNLLLKIPAGFFKTIGNDRFDWRFETEPEPTMAGRRMSWPRGKVLGGSSAINGLIAIRGQPEDYDAWRALGCNGWSWTDVLPYFRRLEDYQGGADALHGAGGPIPVYEIRGHHPICDACLPAARELGIPENRDFNGPQQAGAGYYQVNIRGGLRVNAARGYLKRARDNLAVTTGARVHRILFDGRRVAGVLYERGGTLHRASARQVVLSAGALLSPHLLELSGIGDGAHLQRLGIAVVQHRPAVGQNLQDHLQLRTVFKATCSTFNDDFRTRFSRLRVAARCLINRAGTTWGVSQFGIFTSSDANQKRPDLQFHIHPASGSFAGLHPFSGFTISSLQLRPESRGWVMTQHPDPTVLPAVQANYLATVSDQHVAIAGYRIARRLAQTAALRPFVAEEYEPGVETDEALIDFARATGVTSYHPVGTCRMGSDSDAVVDPGLRLRGVEGLYVADASIMPQLVSGNTHLPTVMIGEKAADLIKQADTLAAE